MKRLIFGCILCVGCTHSSSTTAPTSSVTVIPSATTTTPPSADPVPSATTASASSADPCQSGSVWPVDHALYQKGGDIEILAWRQRSDDRPLFIDEALVWQKTPGAGYVLAQVYRHPKEENEFRLSVVCDAPYQPIKSYDHAPTANDVKEFLKNTTWSHELTGFKLDGGKVCIDNWSRVIGAPPPSGIVK